jgi:AraC-like DNA-binding protein
MLLRHAGFQRLCRARDLLVEAAETQWSIADIARDAQLSPSHFIHQFEAMFGATPHQFRISARIDQAKRLLANGQHSVTDACMEVGFSSLGSFSSLFLRRVGESPSGYQRRVRSLIGFAGRPALLPLDIYPGCLTLLGRLPASAESIFREAPRPSDRADSLAAQRRPSCESS